MPKMSLLKPLNSKTPKVYKHKKLNNANFGNFSHTDYQVFLHLVSKIGGVDKLGKYLQPTELKREYTLTAKEFSEVFDADLNNSYRHLHRSCKKLMKTSIMLERPELSEIWEINVCSTAKYNKNEGYISIKFTDDIMPYLAQVKEKFILYNLKEISNFRSIYTTRLYELLQEFKETGWMLKSVEQLREAFAVDKNFKLYADLKRYTFGHACQEINKNYDINLSFEEIKQGKKVAAIKFSFKPTKVIRRFDQEGITYNTYEKPKTRKQEVRKRKEKAVDVLEGQLSFESLQDQAKLESPNVKSGPELKSIGSMINGFFQKIGIKK